jgi:hypothetical protein
MRLEEKVCNARNTLKASIRSSYICHQNPMQMVNATLVNELDIQTIYSECGRYTYALTEDNLLDGERDEKVMYFPPKAFVLMRSSRCTC